MLDSQLYKATIPMKWVGPVSITGSLINDAVTIPLATFESPLWPSVNRGALVSTLCGGIKATLVDERMTRSILLETLDAECAVVVYSDFKTHGEEIRKIVKRVSKFTDYIGVHRQIVGNLLYMRLEFTTGDAAGHNMVTLAAEVIQNWIIDKYSDIRYVSISGNFCSDKKATAVNGILGRGKNIVSEAIVPESVCKKNLKTTPQKIVELNIKKNLIGTNLAGGIRSANAHFANMLLAFYLATGQDAANIVEGSQGIVHSEVRGGDLYFSVSLPNLVMGTVGSGKSIDFAQGNLKRMGCLDDRDVGGNARRLAAICASSVWCGELSLMAAQTNPGELMETHVKMERT